MYRVFNIEQVSAMMSIYDSKNKHSAEVDLLYIEEFLKDPNKYKLIEILMDKNVPKNMKALIFKALDTSVNYTSIEKFINKPNVLYNIINNLNFSVIYTEAELKAIWKSEQIRSKSTSSFSTQQRIEVDDFFNQIMIPHFFSTSNSQDIRWSNDEAGADGVLFPNDPDKEILVYLRYGMSAGGSQNDRYRSMCSTAKKFPDKKFLFVVDGTEAILQWDLVNGCIKDEDNHYKNAIWSTSKLLHFIDYEKFKFKK